MFRNHQLSVQVRSGAPDVSQYKEVTMSKQIDKLKMLENLGFTKEVKNVKMGKCPFCSEFVVQGEFNDELSEKEFKISGMCQKCQDKIFG